MLTTLRIADFTAPCIRCGNAIEPGEAVRENPLRPSTYWHRGCFHKNIRLELLGQSGQAPAIAPLSVPVLSLTPPAPYEPSRAAFERTFDFPVPLTDRYQPLTLEEFIGLEKPKAVMRSFLAAPFQSAWLYLGESGTGKTTMALALAKALPAELHHIPSRSCDLGAVEDIARRCHYFPWTGKFHVVLVDEADQMSHAAQLAFLSKLDATAFPPATIFIFTANSTRLLEDRFLSRCRTLEFEKKDVEKTIPGFLQYVWKRETGRENGLDFARLARLADGNVRDALSRLEVEIMAAGAEGRS